MTDLLPSEREFFHLLIELAGEGLFCNRPGVQERIMDAFEAAMAEARSAQIIPIAHSSSSKSAAP